MADTLFSAYPLTDEFRSRLAGRVGPVGECVVLQDLRRLQPWALLRKMRSLRSRHAWVILPEEGASAVSGVLCCLAGLSAAGTVGVVEPDLRLRTVPRLRILRWAVGMAKATVEGRFSLRRCVREWTALSSAARIPSAPRPDGTAPGRVVYLKANLWFGVKAGGSVGHVAGVANGLARKGFGVHVWAAEPPPMVDPSVTFRRLQVPPEFGLPAEVNLYRCEEGFVRQLAAAEGPGRADFIYQRLSLGSAAGVLLSRRTGAPLVLEYNGSEVWLSMNWGTGLRFKRAAELAEEVCLRHAHLIVTVSDVLKDELVRKGVEPRRIAVIPNGVDPGVFCPERFRADDLANLRAKYRIPDQARLVTFIGTFGRWHGADLLASAIRTLVSADRARLERLRLHFLLVGDGVMMPRVREILGHPDCAPFVTLTGLVSQDLAPLHLAASDIVVSPHVPNEDGTRFFGSPTKIFEYMAMRKPIIASELEQIGQLLEGGIRMTELRGGALRNDAAALLVRPGSVDELAEGMLFLAGNPSFGRILGENAERRVKNLYTWDHHVGHILDRLRAADR